MKFRVLGGSWRFRRSTALLVGPLTPRTVSRVARHTVGGLTLRTSVDICLWCVIVVFGDVLVCAPLQAQTPASKPVEVVGTFLNVKHSGDDAVGYGLRLWKQGDDIFGLFSVYNGPPADPPVGILEEVKFDPRTRSFSFSAGFRRGLFTVAVIRACRRETGSRLVGG